MSPHEIAQLYRDELQLTPGSADLKLLQDIQSRHNELFSFTSLAAALGRDIRVDSDSVYEKIMVNRLGGYCFEHNKLVYDVLVGFGFAVRIAMGRVVYNENVDRPRTHRLSIVTLNGERYLVDAGFGHFCPRFPVKMEPGLEQDQGDGIFRIARLASDQYGLQIWKEGDFFTLYTFDDGIYTEADCLLGNFYSHKHPTAVFANNLVASRKTPTLTYSLRNSELHLIRSEGSTIEQITSVEQLHRILTELFLLNVDEQLCDQLYARFIASTL
ncbi:arylamine N-acetyltransferase [Oleiphilus messinensis]|uniref:Arylamine N-acetyltransferase n=1 Tax=Oleiphilus messinensis TaxID=141451 RepID=A0A1Y0I2R6_9GAMM|nr:arylamine N-acetyltransferase [Oleiphilus messinensis]ARU54550.1 arylamine N-acetyltransferase [Oleiphilus messinensis]